MKMPMSRSKTCARVFSDVISQAQLISYLHQSSRLNIVGCFIIMNT